MVQSWTAERRFDTTVTISLQLFVVTISLYNEPNSCRLDLLIVGLKFSNEDKHSVAFLRLLRKLSLYAI
jgi:hypothetical protein